MTAGPMTSQRTHSPDEILAWCRAEQPWLRGWLETLVRHESPSTNRAAVNRLGDEIARQLAALGATVDRVAGGERGDHVRAAFDGEDPQILLLGHFDTVWDVGQLANMPLREDAGKLFGPGIFDMKAGIAVSMLMMRALKHFSEAHAPRVAMLWTTDEEIGSGTSRATIEAEARKSRAVLVMEPSLAGGAMKTSRKGCGEFELTVHGVAAHAGLDPAKGASAIHELAQQVVALQALQDLDRGISVNVGLISGGSRPNVVADSARATIDVRAPNMADASRIESAVRGMRARSPRTSLEIRGGFERPPLERSEAVVRLYELAREVSRSLGRELGEGSAGGGSDGNFTAAIGVPTLDGLGPQGDGAHAVHEHVVLDDLPWRAAFLAGLVRRLGALK
jgi:glutamate carboxypeptidase